jgi:hypothetical protein
MRRARWVVVMVIVGCGGTAVIDAEDGGGGAGASGGTAGPGPVGPGPVTGAGGGAPLACADYVGCCEAMCEYMQTLPCPSACEGGCDTLGPPLDTPECAATFLQLLQCVAADPPSALACGPNFVEIQCGPCDAEIAAAEAACQEMVLGCD